MPGPLDDHFAIIKKLFRDGTVVPFLGAGANLCGRPKNATWHQGQYLPSGAELATFLANSYPYPRRDIKFICPECKQEVKAPEEVQDLLRVSQYVALASGSGELYRDLHKIFDADYPPTSLHRFLANLPSAFKIMGCPKPELLIVTTNYDDLMERAFKDAKQSFDTVVYVASGDSQGRFLHWPPQGKPVLIEEPNTYCGFSLEQRPVLLKIHGAINRSNPKQDSYVIKEDDYIDYLARTTDVANVVPSILVTKLKESHLLFLGYSLSDWNLRVMLYRIWSEQKFELNSWAIQTSPQSIDQKFWSKRGVEILNIDLQEYVTSLQAAIDSLKQGNGKASASPR